jgi:hypothetical protein
LTKSKTNYNNYKIIHSYYKFLFSWFFALALHILWLIHSYDIHFLCFSCIFTVPAANLRFQNRKQKIPKYNKMFMRWSSFFISNERTFGTSFQWAQHFESLLHIFFVFSLILTKQCFILFSLSLIQTNNLFSMAATMKIHGSFINNTFFLSKCKYINISKIYNAEVPCSNTNL